MAEGTGRKALAGQDANNPGAPSEGERVASKPGRRGRPPGSVTLTPERADQVMALVRGGASIRSAAQATGIPLRTLQGWLARGSGTSKEPSTPKLRRFAEAVTKARAEAHVSAEVRVHQDQPGRWLHDQIASLDLGPAEGPEEPALDPQELRSLAKALRDALLYQDPDELVPTCGNRRCRCLFHRGRTEEEVIVLRDLTSQEAQQ